MKKIRVAFFVVADLPYILQKVVTDKSTIYELVSKHPSANFWQRQRIYNHTACLERAEKVADVFRTYGAGYHKSVDDIALQCGITE